MIRHRVRAGSKGIKDRLALARDHQVVGKAKVRRNWVDLVPSPTRHRVAMEVDLGVGQRPVTH
jgi:hypothetical protein